MQSDYLAYVEALRALSEIDAKRDRAVADARRRADAAIAASERGFDVEKRRFADSAAAVRAADDELGKAFGALRATPVTVGDAVPRVRTQSEVERIAEETRLWAASAVTTAESLRRTLARLEKLPPPPVPLPAAPPPAQPAARISPVVLAGAIVLVVLVVLIVLLLL